MLAVINVSYAKKQNLFGKIKGYFVVKIDGYKIECGDKSFYSYNLNIPPFNERLKEKAFKRLLDILEQDDITYFVGAPLFMQKKLLELGLKTTDMRKYLMYNLCNLIDTLIYPYKHVNKNVCICENKSEGISKTTLEYCLQYFTSFTLVTDEVHRYDDFKEEILNKTGASIVITNEIDAISDGDLIIIVNNFEHFLPYIKKITKKVVVNLDSQFNPVYYMPQNIITAFCPALPEELITLQAHNLPVYELAAALYFNDIYEKGNINEIFSFGRHFTVKKLKQILQIVVKNSKDLDTQEKNEYNSRIT